MHNHYQDKSILQTKLDYEKFSRQALRSEFLLQLSQNNHAYRHLLRFAGHILLFAGLLYAQKMGFVANPVLGGLAYPFYLFFQGLLISGFMIHCHELSHRHIKTPWLNDLIGSLSGIVSVTNFYSFQHAHRIHHRNIGNLDAPEAGAPISLRGQKKIRHDDKLNKIMIRIFARSKILWFLSSWPLFVYYGDYNSWLLPYREKHRVNRASLAVFIVFALVNIGLLLIFPLAYLSLYLLPVLLGGNRILAITFMHHAHEDSVFFSEEHHNFFNAIMSTTDRDFGRIVNFFMMNNGYHIPHHLNPQIAYYDLKKASAHLRAMMPTDMKYNYYPSSRFYLDFVEGLYEQRLSQNPDVYQIEFLSREQLDGLIQQKRMH